MISFQIKPWLAFWLPYLLIELFYIGMPVVRTDGRSLARSVYGHMIAKFSQRGRLPHFLSYGSPPTPGASRRAWSSAGNTFDGNTIASIAEYALLQATKGARNPNLQVFITHMSHVCNQHSFGLPLTMYGMHRTHFDQARLHLLSLVIWSGVFWRSVTWGLRKAQLWSKSILTFDRCRPHSVTFGYY